MTTIPDPEYLKTDDGVYIAYQVVGHGPVDIAWQLDYIGNLDFWWEAPETGTWFGLVVAKDGDIYSLIAGGIIFAIGVALIIAGAALLFAAYDPPIPDFSGDEQLSMDPASWRLPEPEEEEMRPLYTLALLVCRSVSRPARALRYRDLARAAYVDLDEETRIRYRDAARDQLESMRRGVRAASDAADEAQEFFGSTLAGIAEVLPPRDQADLVARFKEDLGVNEREGAILDYWLEAANEEDLRDGIEALSANGVQLVAGLMRQLHEVTASELADAEYLN